MAGLLGPEATPAGLWRRASDTETTPLEIVPKSSLSQALSLSLFGLWSVRFPPALVRTARRLPVEALGESGALVALTGYPRDGAPGPVLYQGYQKSKRNLVYGIGSQ